jgi:hypothetical protein
MADIVNSLFGLSSTDIEAKQRAANEQRSFNVAQLAPEGYGGIVYGAGRLGYGLGKAAGGLLGIEDPQLVKAKKIEQTLMDVQSELGEDGLINPNKLYPLMAKKLSDAGLVKEAAQATIYGNEEINKYNKLQAELQAKEANALKTNLELQDSLNFKSEIQTASRKAAEEGRTLTSEEIIGIASKYSSADKLLQIASSKEDKETYRQFMIDQAERRGELQLKLAEERQADRKEIEAIKAENKKELEELKTKLSPKGGRTGVYERVYGGRIVTSANEVKQASVNLNVLTNGGMTPQTSGLFKDLEGKGVLSAGFKFFGQTVTKADQQQYEAIMRPVIYNIAQLQGSGQVPRQAQIDNLMKSLIVEPGQKYDAQITKMGELRQIFEASAEAALVNPALTEEQRDIVKSSVNTVRNAIPFTGQDVLLYTTSKDKSLTFGQWIEKNGKGRGAPGKAFVGNEMIERPVSATDQEWEQYKEEIGATDFPTTEQGDE